MDRHRQIQIQKAIEFLEANNFVAPENLKNKIDIINRCSEDSTVVDDYKWTNAWVLLFFNGAEYQTFMPYFKEKANKEMRDRERAEYEQQSESLSESAGQPSDV